MIALDKLPSSSRIWIYQCTRSFTASEKQSIENKISRFTSDWMSHGRPVEGNISIVLDRFIVMSINEADEQACGRSVDASVRLMKELELELGITLLDRMNVAYRGQDGKIISCSMPEFEKLLAEDKVNGDTLVFDNTVHTLSDFRNRWEVPVRQSWHARLMKV